MPRQPIPPPSSPRIPTLRTCPGQSQGRRPRNTRPHSPLITTLNTVNTVLSGDPHRVIIQSAVDIDFSAWDAAQFFLEIEPGTWAHATATISEFPRAIVVSNDSDWPDDCTGLAWMIGYKTANFAFPLLGRVA